jgi:outer membrane protein assembly factor BamB
MNRRLPRSDGPKSTVNGGQHSRRRMRRRLGMLIGSVLLALLVAGCGGMLPPGRSAADAGTSATAIGVANVYNLGGRVQQISVDSGAHRLYALVFTGPTISIGPTRALPIFAPAEMVAVDTQSGRVLWRRPAQSLSAPGTPGGQPPNRIVGITANTANHTVAAVDLRDVSVLGGQSGAVLSQHALPSDFTPDESVPIVDTARNLLYLTGSVSNSSHSSTAALLAWNLTSATPAYRLTASTCGNVVFTPVPAQGRIYLASPIAGCSSGSGSQTGRAAQPGGQASVGCSKEVDWTARLSRTPASVAACAAISASPIVMSATRTAAPTPAAPPQRQSASAQVTAYDARTGKLITSWTLPTGAMPLSLISSAGILVVAIPTGGAVNTMELYDLTTRQIIARLPQFAMTLDANPARGHLYAVDETAQSTFVVGALHGGATLATLPLPGADVALTIASDGTIYLARVDGEIVALDDSAGQPTRPAPTPYWAAAIALSAVTSREGSQSSSAPPRSFGLYVANFPVASGTYRGYLCAGIASPLIVQAGAPLPAGLDMATYMTAITGSGNGGHQVTFALAWTEPTPVVGAPRTPPGRHVWIVAVAAGGSTQITQDGGSAPPATCGPNIYHGPAAP